METNMTSQKYSEQEQNNLNEIEELLNKSSNYVSVGAGEKAVLRFLPERKMEEIESYTMDKQLRRFASL